MMLRIMLATACVALVALSLRADDKAAAKDEPTLDGHWAVTDASAGGKKVELPQNWTFKSNGKANLIDRKAGTQSLFSYKLDGAVTPSRIELIYLGPDARLKDLRQLGIWRLDGDKLTMLLKQPKASDQPQDDDYPSDIAKPGEDEFLLTLEKMPVE
jgi:uncharacterized protein (TIGR03067 family)